MEYKDYYKILGVPKKASEKEIKAAYRKLARKHHPDMNPGSKQAEARFKEINEANEVLSDPEKRRRYDQLGADWDRVRPGSGWPGGGRVRVHVGEEGDLGGFSDFFKTFFGGGFGRGEGFEGFGFGGPAGGEPPGADVEQPVELTLEEVARGATRMLRTEGDGGEKLGEVKIPAGVRDGSRVRVAGKGAGGKRKGDLYLRVQVRPDPRFERKGDDLHTSVSVPLTTAVLGGQASVPTLDGPVGIKVAPGTPVGRIFRLRGHGLPRLEGGGRGDLMATLSVSLPRELSKKERELFEELQRLGH
jgi:DnaJ-class molecular chaperone